MSSYKTFCFESYFLDAESKTLHCHYSIDDTLHFTETFTFELENIVESLAIDKLCLMVFMTAGVSYYKTYIPPNITYGNDINIDETLAQYLEFVYQNGLGEFFYVNDLDPLTPIKFPVNATDAVKITYDGKGALIGIGGGKDSIVTAEALRNKDPASWSVGHKPQLSPLVAQIGLNHYFVERKIDQQLINKSLSGAYNGHVPISALFASLGCLLAALTGKRDVIVSNESSASEATLEYRGVKVNHQFSKSLVYEEAFQKLLSTYFGEDLRYFSYLRNLDEMQISRMFAEYFPVYKEVFSSCNRAFVQSSNTLSWCGKCPKCAFVYLALSTVLPEKELIDLFGKNLLLDPELHGTYQMLLGMTESKPLECVGTIDECRWAMSLAAEKYPQLQSYTLDNNYNPSQRYEHLIPTDYELL